MESLFSLEVVINYVKLNNLRPNNASNPDGVSCLLPCVAIRLLDYPTIAINLLDDYDTKELKTKLQIKEPFKKIETLPCFTELLDVQGRFIFSKGKSCLFRAEMDFLRGHLRNTPMYLLILDGFFEAYKLVGTVLVPLNTVIEEIYQETLNESNEPSIKSVDIPCSKMTHGVVDICNLMGNTIGHVSFACRLTSFGASLLPHIEKTNTEGFQIRLAQRPKEKIETKKQEVQKAWKHLN